MMNWLPLWLILFMCFVELSDASELSDIPEYDRKEWGSFYNKDSLCSSVRAEVLKEEAILGRVGPESCSGKSIAVLDYYNGKLMLDVGIGDVDHLVPLEEAHKSGGHAWSTEVKKRYAQYLLDPNHLILVHRSANRSKGSKDPANWIPSNLSYLPEYLDNWEFVKTTWSLSADEDETESILLLRELSIYTNKKGIKLQGPDHIRKIIKAIKNK